MNLSILAVFEMTACYLVMAFLPNLRGPNVIPFLACFISAGAGYFVVVYRLGKDRLSLKMIWGSALLFRLIMLATSPSLSDDVYRYIWDGHLLNQGVNPYALPVNHPVLDAYEIPIRALVNHNWMASPYLPTLQFLFASVVKFAPNRILGFQVAAAGFDFLSGWLVMDMLRKMKLSPSRVLVYLFNPLVLVEFSHAAHADAAMICLLMLTLWLLVRAGDNQSQSGLFIWASAITMAGAVLTKFLPVLIVPLLIRRWGWRRIIVFGLLVAAVLALFASAAGWGLFGPFDGRGVFGATRIYLQWWNFNSSVYHWLEVGFSGYITPGPVTVDEVGEHAVLFAKLVSAGLLILVVLGCSWLGWRYDRSRNGDGARRILGLVRLSIIPLGTYLVLTSTVHPWYVTIVVPFLPFLLPGATESPTLTRLLWSWLYLSISVSLSYLTYLDLDNLREYAGVREIEYLPFYGLLLWAAVTLWRNRQSGQEAPWGQSPVQM